MLVIPMTPNLLSIRNLCVGYKLRHGAFGHAGLVQAVDAVNFELATGETIAIVGESGCGKSSLVKTILGLQRPTHGEIFFEGQPIHTATASFLQSYHRATGFIQQNPAGALPPFMNVRRILAEPLIIHGVPRSEHATRICQVLEEVNLIPCANFLNLFPHMLSAGQQQRVVIARAIILRPQLLLADEPVSMLDAAVRVEILKLLQQLQITHQMAVIYITHDLSTVRHFAKRIFVMYAGRLVEKANIHELLYNPRHPYTQALLQAIPEIDATNALRERVIPTGEPPNLLYPPLGCHFHPRCSQIMREKCDKKVPVEITIEPAHQTLCWLYAQ
jgi:peptide/nickel transport system ATP-binding protein